MLPPDDHHTADRRSLAVGRLVASRLDDEVLERARARVQAWLDEGGPVPALWAQRWADVLDDGPAAVARVLTSDDERSRDLRQNSPFAGALTPPEWRQIVRTVR